MNIVTYRKCEIARKFISIMFSPKSASDLYLLHY